MDSNVSDEVAEVQQQFRERIQKHLAALREGKSAPAEVSIKLKQDLADEHRRKVNEITEAKKQAILRFDEEIGRLESLAASLENEIAESKKALAADQTTKTSTKDEPAEPSEGGKDEKSAAQPEDRSENKPKREHGKSKSTKQTKTK